MKPKVSVSIVTYNQASLIQQAIESVLMQETNFDFEILIGEDDSNDGTRDIVKEYQARYPEKIRAFFHSRKDVLYIKGRPTGRRNFLNNWKQARGQYVAYLDGDDYWTSPRKLQKLADHLDAHPEQSMCFHNVVITYADGSPDQPFPFKVKKPVYTLGDFLAGVFHVPTCSFMLRHLIGEFPAWYYEMQVGDMPLIVLTAQHGDIGFLDEVMGAYRIHPGGIFTQGNFPNRTLSNERAQSGLEGFIEYCQAVNKHLNYKYDKILRKRISEVCYDLVWLCQRQENWRGMRRYLMQAVKASPFSRTAPFNYIWKAALIAFFPRFYSFVKSAK